MEDDERAAKRAGDAKRDRVRAHALQSIQTFHKTLPADWKFDRDEANSRWDETKRFSE
jgi:antitoxin MazE